MNTAIFLEMTWVEQHYDLKLGVKMPNLAVPWNQLILTCAISRNVK